jgi:hypothetical protein
MDQSTEFRFSGNTGYSLAENPEPFGETLFGRILEGDQLRVEGCVLREGTPPRG